MSDDAGYFRTLFRDVMLALLATSARYPVTDENGVEREERLTDQARRVALLINMMSLGEGEDGWWVSEQRMLAEALEMDASDCDKAVAKLVLLGLLGEERRQCEADSRDGWWYQLRTARIALGDRARRAAKAFAALTDERARAQQRLLIERGTHAGVSAAVVEVLNEVKSPGRTDGGPRVPALPGSPERHRLPLVPGAAASMGRVPSDHETDGESPHREWGESPLEGEPMGRVPIAAHYRGAGARVDSQIGSKSQIVDSGSGGSGGGSGPASPKGPGRGVQFRDSEKEWLAGEILPLVLDELADEPADKREISRRKWLGRIRDEPHALAMALGEMRDEMRGGKGFRTQLGTLFVKARKIASAAGRVLKMLLCL